MNALENAFDQDLMRCVPEDFSVNIAFTLQVTFKAKEGQPSVIKGDIEEEEALMTKIISQQEESKRASNVETKLEEFPIEC